MHHQSVRHRLDAMNLNNPPIVNLCIFYLAFFRFPPFFFLRWVARDGLRSWGHALQREGGNRHDAGTGQVPTHHLYLPVTAVSNTAESCLKSDESPREV
jgi:hypothetical protein